jgi:hypothetical protein
MSQTAFEVLQDLMEEQRQAARDPFHPINDRLRKSLQDQRKQLEILKKSNSIDVEESKR